MRRQKVKNKYNLKPNDLTKAIILNRERLKQKPFWYNSVINAYCLSGGVGRGFHGGPELEYWIGFYDKDAKAYAGKIRYTCSCWEGMGNYKFNSFFNPKDIEKEIDLELQEKFLERINWLIDEGIIAIPGVIGVRLD